MSKDESLIAGSQSIGALVYKVRHAQVVEAYSKDDLNCGSKISKLIRIYLASSCQLMAVKLTSIIPVIHIRQSSYSHRSTPATTWTDDGGGTKSKETCGISAEGRRQIDHC